MPPSWPDLADAAARLARDWREARPERQARRHLERDDFDRLRDAGLLLSVVPERAGGLWHDVRTSARPLCDVFRVLAAGDPSVALVSAMHPAVIGFWLAPDVSTAEWATQLDAVTGSAADGLRWGTITSEPGSGGDITQTRATARAEHGLASPLPGATYLLTGDKHFGSGSGITDLMITTALPDDGDGPALFVIDMRDRPWDGSSGLRLLAEWDGIGMAATQSHAMRLESCPAVRMAFDGPITSITGPAGPLVATTFTAVVLGIVDEAVATARAALEPKAESLRAYERVEWTRAETDHWLAAQAYDGALRAIETGTLAVATHAALRAKASVAELAEATLGRLTRVIGGGAFSRRSPFASWYEDVRALGFLRPPWGLAFDGLFNTSFTASG